MLRLSRRRFARFHIAYRARQGEDALQQGKDGESGDAVEQKIVVHNVPLGPSSLAPARRGVYVAPSATRMIGTLPYCSLRLGAKKSSSKWKPCVPRSSANFGRMP